MPKHAEEVTSVVVGVVVPSFWQGKRSVYLVEVPSLLFMTGLPATKRRDPACTGYARLFGKLT
jgi:hypothetical protein